MSTRECIVCRKPTTMRCPRCLVALCSEECKAKSWAQGAPHRVNCAQRAAAVKRSADAGAALLRDLISYGESLAPAAAAAVGMKRAGAGDGDPGRRYPSEPPEKRAKTEPERRLEQSESESQRADVAAAAAAALFAPPESSWAPAPPPPAALTDAQATAIALALSARSEDMEFREFDMLYGKAVLAAGKAMAERAKMINFRGFIVLMSHDLRVIQHEVTRASKFDLTGARVTVRLYLAPRTPVSPDAVLGVLGPLVAAGATDITLRGMDLTDTPPGSKLAIPPGRAFAVECAACTCGVFRLLPVFGKISRLSYVVDTVACRDYIPSLSSVLRECAVDELELRFSDAAGQPAALDDIISGRGSFLGPLRSISLIADRHADEFARDALASLGAAPRAPARLDTLDLSETKNSGHMIELALRLFEPKHLRFSIPTRQPQSDVSKWRIPRSLEQLIVTSAIEKVTAQDAGFMRALGSALLASGALSSLSTLDVAIVPDAGTWELISMCRSLATLVTGPCCGPTFRMPDKLETIDVSECTDLVALLRELPPRPRSVRISTCDYGAGIATEHTEPVRGVDRVDVTWRPYYDLQLVRLADDSVYEDLHMQSPDMVGPVMRYRQQAGFFNRDFHKYETATLVRAIALMRALPGSRALSVQDDNYAYVTYAPTMSEVAPLLDSLPEQDAPATLEFGTRDSPAYRHVPPLMCLCRDGGTVRFDSTSVSGDLPLSALHSYSRVAEEIERERLRYPAPARRCRCASLTIIGEACFPQDIHDLALVDVDPIRRLEMVLGTARAVASIPLYVRDLARAALVFLLLRSPSAGKIDIIVRAKEEARPMNMGAEIRDLLADSTIDARYRAMLEARKHQVSEM